MAFGMGLLEIGYGELRCVTPRRGRTGLLLATKGIAETRSSSPPYWSMLLSPPNRFYIAAMSSIIEIESASETLPAHELKALSHRWDSHAKNARRTR